jgi:hypothetical protein
MRLSLTTPQSLNPLDSVELRQAMDTVAKAQQDTNEAAAHMQTFKYGDTGYRASMACQDHRDLLGLLDQARVHAASVRMRVVKDIRQSIEPDYKAALRAVVNVIESDLLPAVEAVMALRDQYQAHGLKTLDDLSLEDVPLWLSPGTLRDKLTLLKMNNGL